ncbi:hypothetical protein AB0N05_37415 [Nocardia sp. NPDC051030]|uniref:hypothetical protein n=1 Tax=Nocardia sp. NPDC051030 TaxID=3155162 RepID=UPI0034372487
MKKYWGLFWAATALVIVVAALAIWADVNAETAIGAGLGFVAFFWLVVVVTVPWNLYFATLQAGHRVNAAREREIPVPPAREGEVRTLARRLLVLAVGAHVVSAVAAAVVALLSGYVIGYYVAGFFLASIVFRPAGAYFGYLRARIAAMSRDIAYPPDDVRELREQLVAVAGNLDATRSNLAAWQESDGRQIDELRDEVRRQDQRAREEQRSMRETVARDHSDLLSRAEEVDRRIAAMITRFDTALNGVTDQQELMSGLRALVRFVRETPAG